MASKRIPQANVSPIVSTDEGNVSYPGLTRRRRVWFLRRKIPADLRAKYGKAEVSRSLQTQDYAEALIRYRIAMAELDAEFDQRRGSLRERLLQQARADILRPLVELRTDAEKVAHIHEKAARHVARVSLTRLWEHWKTHATPTPKSAQEALKALSALPADVSAADIKKSHIVNPLPGAPLRGVTAASLVLTTHHLRNPPWRPRRHLPKSPMENSCLKYNSCPCPTSPPRT